MLTQDGRILMALNETDFADQSWLPVVIEMATLGFVRRVRAETIKVGASIHDVDRIELGTK
jgi:hypothetical protein